jgi:hypothetical protein
MEWKGREEGGRVSASATRVSAERAEWRRDVQRLDGLEQAWDEVREKTGDSRERVVHLALESAGDLAQSWDRFGRLSQSADHTLHLGDQGCKRVSRVTLLP